VQQRGIQTLVELWAEHFQCIHLGLAKSNLGNVHEWCCRLLDAFTKISDHMFERKLSDIGTRSNAGDFCTDVEKGVNAGMAIVNTVHTALVIKELVFFHKLNEERMGFSNLLSSNVPLNYPSYCVHQLTEVAPVLSWKDGPEESRA